MESYISHALFDLVTPDGKILTINHLDQCTAQIEVRIEGISSLFMGYQIDPQWVFFNLKSTLAQLGIDSLTEEMELDSGAGVANLKLSLQAIGPVAVEMIKLLQPGAAVGKLFAADPRRRVRDPDYLLRMFSRSDQWGRPLLSLGGREGGQDLVFEVIEGRTVAYLSLRKGRVEYTEGVRGLLPTVAEALKRDLPIREFLGLHQRWDDGAPRRVEPDQILLVKTAPLHVRTVFGSVVNELLPKGFRHTTASVLQPDTMHSGDVYELHGSSKQELSDMPLEFYTLEPHREHIFFSDRDQLQADLEDPEALFSAFETAPEGESQAAVLVVKGTQMRSLTPVDWVEREPMREEFPGLMHGTRQAMMVERYIEKQAQFPFLKAIEEGSITSQGVLLTRYLPSPLMKRMLLADFVQSALKGIYFLQPSLSGGDFFSSEDRTLLLDLARFGIPVYWVDRATRQILMYVPRHSKDCGMFVPLNQVARFQRATFIGIYGSNLLEGVGETELRELLEGLKELQPEMEHPLLNPDTPLAMVSGGGPGAMEVGNKVAKELGILSCGNIVDFRPRDGTVVNEQRQNPYIEAKMTYRLDQLVERQAEFHLDLPIFVQGGIGTDFEFALEEVRRKTGTGPSNPVLLFGTPEYWRQKITSRFQCNRDAGTIAGSEWVSNAFYCVETAAQGLAVYRDFFEGKLKIGPKGPIFDDGFSIRSS